MNLLSRRHFVATGLGVLLVGCSETRRLVRARPGPLWPTPVQPTHATGKPLPIDQPSPSITPAPAPPALPTAPVRAIPRSKWTRSAPLPQRLRPMRGVNRITIHHEGWTPVWFTDARSVSQRLESIRRSHLDRLGAGDIGYHLIIDRAGRVWQGRSMGYQGAHVRDHNAHNIGVMVMGNFDLQRPSDAQHAALHQTLVGLVRQYRIPSKHVFTHQEFNVTSCPGRSLQKHTNALRRSGKLA